MKGKLKDLLSCFNKNNLVYRKVKTVRKGDSLFLRVPEITPKEILDDFSGIFKKFENIQSAYLAEGFLEAGEDVHYIIGLKIEGIEIGKLMESMAQPINEKIPKTFYVDFIEISDKKITKDNSIDNFMRNYLIPFYSR